jgi:Fur family ferric uptake transcriptional regulator
VRQVLREADEPLTPAEILHRAQRHVPSIGQATVYRHIKRLLDDEAIVAVQLPDQPPRYEVARDTHHHFFTCRRCVGMTEISGCDELVRQLTPRGCTLEDHEVFLFGLCRDCRRQK